MLKTNAIYIFGYSGHAYVVIESALELGLEIKGYFDKQEAVLNPYCLTYMGYEKVQDIKAIVGDSCVFPTIGDNKIRSRMVKEFDILGLNQMAIIDRSALVSPSVSVERSSYIGKGTIINAHTQIGAGVIVNTGAIVEHECLIEDGCHIAPGTTLCGRVAIGANSLIGAHSVVRPNTNIIKEVILGAGSVLVCDVLQTGVWFGNPAKQKE